ncbi:MAG TPA: TIGR02221 family CRISPR-associated protein [Treponemataceae bacterium]|nr:TIGR02221 family CRISPR-associated protein [Treponemataceae bacterium]
MAMPKKFISFLGTGNYQPCMYTLNNRKSKSVYFIQEALIDFVCNDFEKEDSLVFFLSSDARSKNWSHLHTNLCDKKLKAPILDISIPDSKTEAGIWDLFNVIFTSLDENDSIIFDLTHSFRFLPMLCFSVLHYASFLKNISVEGVYYGAWETRDIETSEAPIFNLTDSFTLMQWANAADVFTNYGISGKINTLVKKTAKDFHGTSSLADKLKNIEITMSTVRGSEIQEGKVFTDCREKIKILRDENIYQPALKPLLDVIENKISRFSENSNLNFLYAAQWYIKHNMTQQAFTIMEEGIITYLIEKFSGDFRDLEQREACSSSINHAFNTVIKNDSEWNESTSEQKHRKLTADIFIYVSMNRELLVLFNKLVANRNDINHAGYKSNISKGNTLLKTAENIFTNLQELFINKENNI